jgi:hypothetical protein
MESYRPEEQAIEGIEVPYEVDQQELENTNPFLRAVRHATEDQEFNLSIALEMGRKMNQEKETRINELSMRHKFPIDWVRRNFDEAERLDKTYGANVPEMVRESPATARYLSNPANVALSADDSANLKGMEWLWEASIAAFETGTAEAEYGLRSFAQMNEQMLETLGWDKEGNDRRIKYLEQNVLPAFFGEESVLERGWINFVRFLPQMIGAGATAAQFAAVAAAAGQMGPQALAPEEVISVPGAAAAGAFTWTFMQEAGFAYQELKKVRDENGNAIDPNLVYTASIGAGAANGALELLGMKSYVKMIPGGRQFLNKITRDKIAEKLTQRSFRQALKNLGKDYVEGALVESSTEFAQELTPHIARALVQAMQGGDWEEEDLAQIFGDAVDVGLMTLEAMAVGGGLLSGPKLFVDVVDANRAGRAYAEIAAYTGNARASKTLERAPDKFKQHVKMVQEKHGVAKNVYIPIEKWNEAWGENAAREVALKVTGSYKAYDDAMAHDADLIMPVEDYLAHVAKTETHEKLHPNMRLHQGVPTINEVNESREEMQAVLQEAMTRDPETFNVEEQEIYSDVYRQTLRVRGDAAEADANARLRTHVTSTLASRTNRTAMELYKRYDVRFHRDAEGKTIPIVATPNGRAIHPIGDSSKMTAAAAAQEATARKLSEGLQRGDPAAIKQAAKEMAEFVPAGATLVPVPDSRGDTSANRLLAEAIAKLTKAGTADVLMSSPREAQEARRLSGRPGFRPTEIETNITDVGQTQLEGDSKVVLIDSVRTTGSTIESARQILPDSKYLTYAQDEEMLGDPAAYFEAEPGAVEAVRADELTAPGADRGIVTDVATGKTVANVEEMIGGIVDEATRTETQLEEPAAISMKEIGDELLKAMKATDRAYLGPKVDAQIKGVENAWHYPIMSSETGLEIGYLEINITDDGDTIVVTDIRVDEGPGAVGFKAVRKMLDQLRQDFPQAKAIEGFRISGMKGRAAERAVEEERAIDISETRIEFQGIETPHATEIEYKGKTYRVPRFYRGGPPTEGKRKPRAQADAVVAAALEGVQLYPHDEFATVAEALEWAQKSERLQPTVLSEKKPLRYQQQNELGFYGNEKMAYSNDAYPGGRNTYDIPGCGRVAWAILNGQDLKTACFGGACYAERLLQGKQGKKASVAAGVRKFAVRGAERTDIVKYVRKWGLKKAQAKYANRTLAWADPSTAAIKPVRESITKIGLKKTQQKYPEWRIARRKDGSYGFRKLSVGRFESSAGEELTIITAETAMPAAVSTNLEPADGQDIRLGVDTDGSAWLSNKEVLDALLESNPRTLSVYSSAYHAPPPRHPLAGRTILNVTVSGWHPLGETLARLRYAEEARANGWNVILREVTADPAVFGEEKAAGYNRIHEALLQTDFFVMQQPLHEGRKHGEALWSLPGCCVGSKKNQHTCDECEVSEGLGKRFQAYWDIADETAREENLLPDVESYKGRQLLQLYQTTGQPDTSETDLNTPRVIDSPAFREWFQNSVVVTEDGEPMVLYHGTWRSFEEFGGRYTEGGELSQLGWHYFTPNASLAAKFAVSPIALPQGELKIRRTTVRVTEGTPDKPVKVKKSAYKTSIPGLVVAVAQERFKGEKRGKKFYSITHTASGYAVSSGHRSIEEAFSMVEALDEVDFDWTQTKEEILAIPKSLHKKIGRTIRDAMEKWNLEVQGFASMTYKGTTKIGVGSRMIPVYLSMQNPLDLRDLPARNTSAKKFLEALSERGIEIDRTEVPFSRRDLYQILNMPNVVSQIKEQAHQQGYDGVIFKDFFDETKGGRGDTFVAFESNQIKSAIGNRGTFDPRESSILYQPKKDAKGKVEARGYIEYAPRGRKFNIHHLEADNASTAFHETAHFYLELLGDLAEEEGAPADIINDHKIVMKWMGVESREEMWALQDEFNRRGDRDNGPLERFARGFEQYLLEGKAPTVALVPVMSRISAWFKIMYRKVEKIIDINDDIRGVFDRLVASEQEIAEAEAKMQAGMLDVLQEHMSGMEWQEYTLRAKKVTADSEDKLRARLMAEGTAREMQDWFVEETNRTRAEVEEEFADNRKLNAIHYLTLGESLRYAELPDTLKDENGKPFKLSKKDIVKEWGEGTAKALPRQPWVYTTRKTGVHPDVLAPLLGYSSGDALIKDLEGAPQYRDAVAEEVKRRLDDRYGNLLEEPSRLADEALDAATSSQRIDQLQVEIRVLARALDKSDKQKKRRPFNVRALKEAALKEVQTRRVGDLKAHVFQRAAAKHGTAAANSTNVEKIYDEKVRQAWNMAMYRAIRDTRERMDKHVRYLNRMGQPPAQQRLGKAGTSTDPDWYRAPVNDILHRIDIKKLSSKGVRRKQALREWVEKVSKEEGTEFVVPERILNDTESRHFTELTVDELDEVVQTIKNIDHLARLKTTLLVEGQRRDFSEARAELIAALQRNLRFKHTDHPDEYNPTWLEAQRDRIQNWDSRLLRIEELIRRMDGGEVDGPWARYLWNPIVDAQTREQDLMADIVMKLTDTFDNLPMIERKKLFEKKTKIDTINDSLTRQAMLVVALNSGSESNLQRLIDGKYRKWKATWGPEAVEEILGKLTKEEWAFVQGVWKTMESLWPQIEALERRLTGVPPKRVKTRTWMQTLPDGTEIRIEGGYYPLVYRQEENDAGDKQANAAKDVTVLFDHGMARAMTGHGHVIDRVVDFNAPIKMNLGVITRHLSQVVHDLSHREAVLSVAKIIRDPEIKYAMYDHLGKAYAEQFMPWIKRIAGDLSGLGDPWFNNIIGRGRMNATIVAMGFKATVSIQNLANFANILEPTKGVKRKYLSKAMRHVYRNPKMVSHMIHSKSGEMRHRFLNLERDIRQAMTRLIGKRGVIPQTQRFAFHTIAYTDALTAYPAWLGAYWQKCDELVADGRMSDREIEKVATRHADRVVRTTLTAAGPKDLAAIQTGGELMKWLTMFYSWFSCAYMRQRSLHHDVKKKFDEGGVTTGDFCQWAARIWCMWLVPATLAELLSHRGPDEEEDEGWLEWMAMKIGFYPFLTMPLIRDIANQLEQSWTGGYRRGIKFGPIAAAADEVEKAIEMIFNLPEIVRGNDDAVRQIAKQSTKTAGYLVGLPSSQATISAGYVWDLWSGDDDWEGVTEFATDFLFYRKDAHHKRRRKKIK